MNIAVLGGHYLKNYQGEHRIWTHDLPLSINTEDDNSISTLLARECPFSPDILFFGDQSCFPMITGLEDLRIPVVAYLIDTHLHYPWHRYFSAMFDHVFVAQYDCSRSIAEYNPACEWMPLFSRLGDIRQGLQKEYDITFVGTVDPKKNSDRVKFLNSFSEKLALNIFSGEYVERFNKSKIILNQSVANDINFRVFEAMASGSLLLTDDVGNGLGHLFEDGRHLVTYEKGDVDDAAKKARYYLDNTVEREKIAEEGHRLIVNRHTLEFRIQQLLEKMSAIVSGFVYEPNHQNVKKIAAGRTYLAIAQLTAQLESQHKNGHYGGLSNWYLKIAHELLSCSLESGVAEEGIIKDLATLYFLENDFNKATLYLKMALLANPDDIEMYLLGAEIAHYSGEISNSRDFFSYAKELLKEMAKNQTNLLDVNVLSGNLSRCGRLL
jgi:hypothetical protein